jgi:hypothetical protein
MAEPTVGDEPRQPTGPSPARRTARGVLRRRLGPRASIDAEVAAVEQEVGRLLAAGDAAASAGAASERRAVLLAYEIAERLLRGRHAPRWQLRSRIRYVLTHHPALGLWLDPRGSWVTGLSGWEGRSAGPLPGVAGPGRRPADDGIDLAAIVSGILTEVGHPIALDDLLEVAARRLAIAEASQTDQPVDLATAHPGHEELAGFVDGVLDAAPNEVVAAHVAECPACGEETQQLRQVWRTLLAPAAPTPTMPILVRRPPGVWSRLGALALRLLGKS